MYLQSHCVLFFILFVCSGAHSNSLTTKDEISSMKNKTTSLNDLSETVNTLSDAAKLHFSLAIQNLLFIQKELLEEIQELIANISSMQQQLKENPLPKGFIYIQLPLQEAPQELWPCITWEDVTSKYAGNFFRALGGDSGPFGSSQGDNAPRLTSVSSFFIKANNANEIKHTIVPSGGTSARIWTGDDRPGYHDMIATSFTNSGGEVRPKNMAVKIWKRQS